MRQITTGYKRQFALAVIWTVSATQR